MKKSKSWIHTCVHFLLFMTLGVHSATLDVQRMTDDIDRELPVLRHNIPKDYNISLQYIPKEMGKTCWVKLNLVYLNQSLKDLSNKFGNSSSNKELIKLIMLYVEEERRKIQKQFTDLKWEDLMWEFQCHSRQQMWETGKYFDFVKEFFRAAKNEDYSDDCSDPECPVDPTKEYSTGQPLESQNIGNESWQAPPFTVEPPSPIVKIIEKSLFSLLFIPLLALIFLLVWKVRSKRNVDPPQPNRGEEDPITSPEERTPPLDGERNVLHIFAKV
ncbi:kit ligand a [Cyprinodon tularosa]|uniref:Kit ligand n=1 Tax=Cyprinodon variegatus TaxID=28743 RepID=A0A3Q2CNK5_CYPVA|nr:PREDICTED: kit ligand [Cyprinodon variegatus]XP_038142864.1 kit ligand a [Cyprinodon tularosa]